MVLTKEFIMQNRTHAGAWTRDQLLSIGVEWPPSHGWIKRAAGKEIADKQAEVFKLKRTAKQCRNKSLDNKTIMPA